MNCKNLIATVILALSGLSAHASERNSIDLFSALADAGVSMEQSMGKTYVGVRDFWCSRENSYSGYTCEMTDNGIAGEDRKITVRGEVADLILSAIPDGAGPFDPYSKFELSIESITCYTVSEALIDIHQGEQAVCTIQ